MEKRNLLDLLKGNPYPGRGIVLGKSADGKQAVAVLIESGVCPHRGRHPHGGP